MNFSGVDSADGTTAVNIDVTDLGARHGPVHVTPTSDPNGDYAHNLYTPISVTGTAAEIIVVTGLHSMHSGQFIISALSGGETVAVTSLSDAGTALGAPLIRQVDHATPGTLVNPTALGNGTYQFVPPLTVAGLTFTKSAAVNSVTLVGLLSGAS